ncbi:MAG: hypothetical protein J6X60_04105, partial [Ruminiclostridium sp.]|nr:hypothetical protein [Ruminiclostridium sp.]
MKKLAGGIAAVIASAVMLTSMVSAEDTADTNDLLVLGDSIATGYGLEGYIPGDNTSAAGSFANKLSANYDNTVNLAVDGRTAGELVESLTSDEKTKSSIATADTIVFSAGGNEILRPLVANILAVADATDLKSFGEALAADKEGKLIADIQTAVAADQNLRTAADTAVTEIAEALVSISAMNPEADILILTIYNPFDGIPGLELISGTSDEILTTINTSIFAAADAINGSNAASVSVIDVASLFDGKAAIYTNITSADIHPNAAGHAAFYGLLAEYAPAGADDA